MSTDNSGDNQGLQTGYRLRPLPYTRVVATGTVSAVGSGVEVLRAALASGQTGLAAAGVLPDGIGQLPFGATAGVVPFELPAAPPSKLYRDTRQVRMAWQAAAQLEGAAREAVAQWGGDRVGLILGTSTGGILSTESALLAAQTTGELPRDYSCEYAHNMDAAARYLAEQLAIVGPVYVVSVACASGAKALASARRLIDLGLCDAVVAGGVDSICRMTLHGFHSLGVLSEHPCRPLSEMEHGMNVAEGATLFLLERAEVLAPDDVAFVGAGESSDAHHMSAPDPSGTSQALAMSRALADAGFAAKDVDYVNAHGTGTKANDRAEALALRSVTPFAPASSTKGLLGHQLGAAGATEALIATELLRGAAISCDGALEGERFPLQVADGGVSLSNSFAFGGANVCLAFSSGNRARPKVRAMPEILLAGIVAYARVGPEDGVDSKDLGKEVFTPRVRARASELTRLGAHLVARLGLPAPSLADIPLIVGSALGQIRTTRRLIELFLQHDSSPLLFQNSVHNATAGALSLALGNRAPSSSVAAGADTSFCALLEGLLYLWTHPEYPEVIVLCVDESPPEDLGLRGYPSAGAAFLLRRSTVGCQAVLTLVHEAQLPREVRPLPIGPAESEQPSPEAIALARFLDGFEHSNSPDETTPLAQVAVRSSFCPLRLWLR